MKNVSTSNPGTWWTFTKCSQTGERGHLDGRSHRGTGLCEENITSYFKNTSTCDYVTCLRRSMQKAKNKNQKCQGNSPLLNPDARSLFTQAHCLVFSLSWGFQSGDHTACEPSIFALHPESRPSLFIQWSPVLAPGERNLPGASLRMRNTCCTTSQKQWPRNPYHQAPWISHQRSGDGPPRNPTF